MVFLSEVWFVIQHVPELAHRYENYAIFATVFLVLSLATKVAKSRLVSKEEQPKRLLKWLSAATWGLTVLVFALAFIDLVKDRLPFDDMVCTNISVDAYYHPPDEQTYDLIERAQCSNRTPNPIRNFAPLRDGYYQKLDHWTVQAALLNHPGSDFRLHSSEQPEERKNMLPHPGTDTLYLYQASAEFLPPVDSGADIDLVYKISAFGGHVEAPRRI